MRRFQILSLAVLLFLVCVAPRARVSARKQRLDAGVCAPGEVIIKFKQGAAALASPDQGERSRAFNTRRRKPQF